MNNILSKLKITNSQINFKSMACYFGLLCAYWVVFYSYRYTYDISAVEVIKPLGVIIIFFMIPGSVLSNSLFKLKDENIIIRGLFYILVGMPVSLLIFYLSNYYEDGTFYWFLIVVSMIVFLWKIKKTVVCNEPVYKKSAGLNGDIKLLLFLFVIVLIVNINRPVISVKPVDIDGQKVYDSYINHDYLFDLAKARLFIKDTDLKYTEYLGGIESRWGYYTHSPLGHTLMPFIAKYSVIDPVVSFTIITPILLLFLLLTITYLILRKTIHDKRLSYLGMILMGCALPLEYFLGLSENLYNYGQVYDRHSMYLGYAFSCIRYFMGHVYVLLLFYLLFCFSQTKKYGISVLIGLIFGSFFFVKETYFLGAGISVFLAFMIHFITSRAKKKILIGGIIIAICLLPIFIHYIANKAIYYDASGNIFNPIKPTFEIGVLSEYFQEGFMFHQGETLVNKYMNRLVSIINEIPERLSVIKDISYVILYDVGRGYGVMIFFLIIGMICSIKKSIAHTAFIFFVIIMTLFENSFYVKRITQSDIGVISGLSGNNIEILHYIAVIVSFIIFGKIYLVAKTEYNRISV
jgi:hypothetical protein